MPSRLFRAICLTLVLLLEGMASAVLLPPTALLAAEQAAPVAAMPCHQGGATAADAMPCCDGDDAAQCHAHCLGTANPMAPMVTGVTAPPDAIPQRVAVFDAALPGHLALPFRPPASLES